MGDSFLDKLTGMGGGSLLIGLMFLLAIGVVGLQIVSMILTQIFGLKMLALGPAIAIISVVTIIMAGFMTAMSPDSFSGKTWFVIAMLVGVTVFLYWGLPQLQPELFKPAMSTLKVQTMSILGMG